MICVTRLAHTCPCKMPWLFGKTCMALSPPFIAGQCLTALSAAQHFVKWVEGTTKWDHFTWLASQSSQTHAGLPFLGKSDNSSTRSVKSNMCFQPRKPPQAPSFMFFQGDADPEIMRIRCKHCLSGIPWKDGFFCLTLPYQTRAMPGIPPWLTAFCIGWHRLYRK